jgi:hypothetical protein
MKIRRAYVQQKDGDWLNETAFTMKTGCEMLGIEVVPFEGGQVNSLDLHPDTLVHGGVGTVRRALARLGAPDPAVPSLPPELEPLYKRHIWNTTLGMVRLQRNLFVKPANDHKIFTGQVMRGELADLVHTAPFPDDLPVVASEVVRFVSEYRLFVHNSIIVGAKHYVGDFTKAIDYDYACRCTAAFRSAPVAYSLDLGVRDDGETDLVEVNRFFSLGSYGLAPLLYAQLAEDCWVEMVAPLTPKA